MRNHRYFVYGVDIITPEGLQTAGMILDHAELADTVREARQAGYTIAAATVAMYDDAGALLAERDVTAKVAPGS
jgi:hypothetical protein